MQIQNSVIKFNDHEELDEFITRFPDSQHIVIDEDCLRVRCYFRVVASNTRRATVQIKEENEQLFDVKPSVDGGVVLINKAQVDLFETEPVHA